MPPLLAKGRLDRLEQLLAGRDDLGCDQLAFVFIPDRRGGEEHGRVVGDADDRGLAFVRFIELPDDDRDAFFSERLVEQAQRFPIQLAACWKVQVEARAVLGDRDIAGVHDGCGQSQPGLRDEFFRGSALAQDQERADFRVKAELAPARFVVVIAAGSQLDLRQRQLLTVVEHEVPLLLQGDRTQGACLEAFIADGHLSSLSEEIWVM